jgi:phospholipid transport system transporter-binding protein
MIYQPGTPLTIYAAKAALAEGLRAIETGATRIDLSAIHTVDSATVALLLAWQRAALARGTPFAIVNASEAVTSLAKLYSVDELLHFTTDRDAVGERH